MGNLEEQLKDNLKKQTILYEIYRRANNELDIDSIIGETLEILQNYLEVDGLGFFLVDENGQDVVLHSSIGFDEELSESIKRRKIGEGVAGIAIQKGSAQFLKLIDFPDEKTHEFALKSGLTDIGCYPLKVGGMPIGATCITNKNNRPIDIKDQELFTTVCSQISTLLQNAKLFSSLKNELLERRRTEQELRKLTTAVEQSPAIVMITDPMGDITYVNPKFTEVTGYTYDEVIGKNPRFLKSGEKSSADYKKLWDTITAGGTWRGENHNKKKNGELYWESASISPVFNEDGEITYYVAVKEDNTKIKLAYEELNKAKENAERANAAKSIFLANMSHEIRTPMNAILGFTQLLLKDQNLNGYQHQYLETIGQSGEYLLSLINDILEMSKIESGHVTLAASVFDLYSFIDSLNRMLKPRIDVKNLKFIIDRDESLERYIEADENRLRQILINLIGNAIKFTDTGSIIWRIRTIKNSENNICLISEVEDTGPGINEKDIIRLFKAFEQTETGAKAGGTGLGLAISQKYAEMMDGKITVESEIGKGSCFKLIINVKNSEGDQIVEKDKEISNKVIGIAEGQMPPRVLIVDDKVENRLLLKEMLGRIGYETLEASDGIQAISCFEKWNPNVILMDMRMPNMDGYEATRAIKSSVKGRQTPVIAVTASAFEDEKNKIISTGVSGYIRKPFSEQELYKGIAQCIDIKYIYDNDELTEPKKSSVLDKQELSKLPSELLIQMREATINGDSDKLSELISGISKELPLISHQLMQLADNYQYEVLLNLFKQGS